MPITSMRVLAGAALLLAGTAAGTMAGTAAANAGDSACPGKSSHCDCSWTHGGKMCGGKDDGSECFCRCCCEHKGAGFKCMWKGGTPPAPPSPPSPSPPAPSPPPPPPAPPSPAPPPSPPGACTTDQQLTITENGQTTTIWVKSAGKSNKGITVSGGNLTMEHGPRAYLVSGCTEAVTPSTFATMLWNETKTLVSDASPEWRICRAAIPIAACAQPPGSGLAVVHGRPLEDRLRVQRCAVSGRNALPRQRQLR